MPTISNLGPGFKKEKLGKTTNKALHYAAKPIDYSDHEGLITSGSIHFWDYKTDEYGFQSNDSTDWNTEVKVLTGVNGNWEFSGHYEHAVAPSLLDPDFENFQAWVYNAENNNFLTYVDLDPVDHTGHYTAIPGKPLEFRLVAKRKTGDVKWSHKTPTAELLDDTPPGKLTNFEGEIWFNNLYRFGWDAPHENDIEKIQLYTGEPLADNKADPDNFLLEKFEPTSQEIIFSIDKYSDLAVTQDFYAIAVDFSNNSGEASNEVPVSRLGSNSDNFNNSDKLDFEAGEDGSFVTGNITPNNPDIENDSNFLEYRIRIWDKNSDSTFPVDTQYLDNAQAGEDIRYEGIPGKEYKIDFCVHTKDGNYICKSDLDVTLPADETGPSKIHPFKGRVIFNEWYKFNWPKPSDTDIEKIQLYTGLPDGSDEPVSANLLLERFEPTNEEILFHVNDAGKIADLPVIGSEFYAVAVDFSDNTGIVSDVIEVSRIGDDPLDGTTPALSNLELTLYEEYNSTEEKSYISGDISSVLPSIQDDPNFLRYRVQIYDNNNNNRLLETKFINETGIGPEFTYEAIPGKEYKIELSVQAEDFSYISIAPTQFVIAVTDDDPPAAIENFKVKQVFDDLVFTWDAPPEEDCETIVICSGVDGLDSNLKNTPSPASKIYKSGIGKYSVFSEPTQSFFDEGFRDTIAFNAFAVDLSKNSGDFGSVVQEVDFQLKRGDPIGPTTGLLESITPEGNTRYFLTGKFCHDSVNSESFHHGRFRVGPKSKFALKSETYLVSDIEDTKCLKFSSEVLPNIEYKITLSLENSTNQKLTNVDFGEEFTIPSDDVNPAEVQNVSAEQLGSSVFVTWDANTDPDLKGYVLSTGNGSPFTQHDFLDKSETSTIINFRPDAGFDVVLAAMDTSLNTGEWGQSQVGFTAAPVTNVNGIPGIDEDSIDGSYNCFIKATATHTAPGDDNDLELIEFELKRGIVLVEKKAVRNCSYAYIGSVSN